MTAPLTKLYQEFIYKNLGYHTWVSESYKYMYFGVPKAACTRIKLSLQQLEGYRVPDRIMDIHDRADPALQYPKRILDFTSEKQHEILCSSDWLRFSFVRNPYFRIYSAFENQVLNFSYREYDGIRQAIRGANGITFERFVEYITQESQGDCDSHWEVQHTLLGKGLIDYFFIGRQESFSADFSHVLSVLGAPHEIFSTISSQVNQRIGAPPESVFTEHIASQIYEYYKVDFEAFAYHPDSWPRHST